MGAAWTSWTARVVMVSEKQVFGAIDDHRAAAAAAAAVLLRRGRPREAAPTGTGRAAGWLALVIAGGRPLLT